MFQPGEHILSHPRLKQVLTEGQKCCRWERRTLPALDACRGFCAVAVVVFSSRRTHAFLLASFVRNGWVAVDFFFVLSGFVIASAYGARLKTAADALRFALRRFGRLYPLHIMVLCVYIGIELVRRFVLHTEDAFAGTTSTTALVESLFLVQGFTPDHEAWNYPAWSISIELWTNLALAAFVVLLVHRFRYVMVSIMLLAAAFVVANDYTDLPIPEPEVGVLMDVARSIFGFFLGYAAFLRFEKLRGRWKPLPVVELAVSALGAVVVLNVEALSNLVPSLVFALVVFIFAFETGALSALLRMRACVLLGTISYSIYLTHSLYLLALQTIIRGVAAHLGVAASAKIGGNDLLVLGGPWAMDGAALLCVAATLGGSFLTYRYIEEPARQFFNRLAFEGAPRRFGQAAEEAPAR
ncbi:MAG: acyltransferase [Rhizomicrobium sp.]